MVKIVFCSVLALAFLTPGASFAKETKKKADNSSSQSKVEVKEMKPVSQKQKAERCKIEPGKKAGSSCKTRSIALR